VSHKGVVGRVLASILGVDVFFGLLIPIAFVGSLGGPLGKVFAIHFAVLVVHVAVNVLHLSSQLAPVDLWLRTEPADRTDAMVRRAAVALQGLPKRQTLLDTSLFALAAVATPVVLVTILHDEAVSARYYLPSFGAAASVVCGGSALMLPLVEALTSDLHAELMADSAARKLDVTPAPASIPGRIAALALGLALAPLPWMAGIGYRTANDDARDVALQEARMAAAVSALGGAVGTVATESAVRVVDAADTSRCVSAARESSGVRLAGYVDVPNEAATACIERRDGRYAIAVVPVSGSRTTGFLVSSAAFLVVVAFWAPLVAFFFGRWIGRPVGRLAEATRRLSEVGDIGAMGALPIPYDDELGALSRSYNAFLGDLRNLAWGATSVAQGNLKVTISGRGELPDAFRGMLERLRDLVRPLRETSVQIASAAAEIYSASQEQEAAATQQSAGMTEVLRTMESLSGSAAHIADSVRGVLSDAERTRENTDQMASRIAELNAHATRIGELLEVIRDVADRSDLLALNGSLEATHAGEAGKGFSLIAGEMRRLAERVTATVDGVRTLLADIRASGSSAVMATEQSRKVAESTTEAARRITLVVQQQRSATDAVSASVRDVTTVVAQAAVATTQTRVSAEDLKTQADRLETLLRRFVIEASA
jgi:methyl-accepting chemotaxis protein